MEPHELRQTNPAFAPPRDICPLLVFKRAVGSAAARCSERTRTGSQLSHLSRFHADKRRGQLEAALRRGFRERKNWRALKNRCWASRRALLAQPPPRPAPNPRDPVWCRRLAPSAGGKARNDSDGNANRTSNTQEHGSFKSTEGSTDRWGSAWNGPAQNQKLCFAVILVCLLP